MNIHKPLVHIPHVLTSHLHNQIGRGNRPTRQVGVRGSPQWRPLVLSGGVSGGGRRFGVVMPLVLFITQWGRTLRDQPGTHRGKLYIYMYNESMKVNISSKNIAYPVLTLRNEKEKKTKVKFHRCIRLELRLGLYFGFISTFHCAVLYLHIVVVNMIS